MLQQLPAYLWYLENEFKVPAAMMHPRFGVEYRNPIIDSRLIAPTESEIVDELQDIIGVGVFTNIEDTRSDIPLETVTLRAGEVIDRVMHLKSLSRERARQHPNYFNVKTPTMIGNLLTELAKTNEGVYEKFTITQVQSGSGKSKKSKYTFTRLFTVEGEESTLSARACL